jgi:hypothetical protein
LGNIDEGVNQLAAQRRGKEPALWEPEHAYLIFPEKAFVPDGKISKDEEKEGLTFWEP